MFHDGLGNAVAPPALANFTVLSSAIVTGCGEPTGGVAQKNDYVFQVCSAGIYRSTNHGLNWTKVSTQLSSPTTLDPMMWFDARTDRVYSIQLYVGCSWLSYSDDYGNTWTTNPFACGMPVNDHQTMGGGPPSLALPMPVYPDMLYYCANTLQFAVNVYTMCARSFDGGLTFTGNPDYVAVNPANPTGLNGDCLAMHGHVKVSSKGTAYLPKKQCHVPAVLTSTNDGLTWTEHIVSTKHPTLQASIHTLDDPVVATDAAGTAYYLWTGDDGILWMSHSTDQGVTWSDAIRVGPPDLTMPLFAAAVGGDAGHLAIAYLGTTQPREGWKYATDAPRTTVWNLYLTETSDAQGDDPTFETVQVNPQGDPVQRGCVWLEGFTTQPIPDNCRNLADFIDVTMGHDGRAYIHYVDGCRDQCVTWDGQGPPAHSSMGMVGVVESGPSLLEGHAPLVPFT